MMDNNVSTRQEVEDLGYVTIGELTPTENFYLSKEGITFYYNVYDIAPYVMTCGNHPAIRNGATLN